MTNGHPQGMRFAGAILLAMLLCPDAAPAQTQEKWIARAISVQGTVEARQAGATTSQPAKLKNTHAKGETNPGGERGRADPGKLQPPTRPVHPDTAGTPRGVQGERPRGV